MDHRITWNQQQKRQTNSDQPRTKTDDKCLSIKDLRYISFGRTDGTEDTDFFFRSSTLIYVMTPIMIEETTSEIATNAIRT